MDKDTEPTRYVGIDVGKKQIEVYIRPDGIAFSCGTDPGDLAVLVSRVTPFRSSLKVIVLEATGGYEAVIAGALSAAALPVAIVNPRQTRQFAAALGQLAKTDKIDAPVIAHFAEAVKLEPQPPADAQITELRALLSRRSQLIEMRTAEKQRVAKAANKLARRSCEKMLRHLETEILLIEKAIGKLIDASPVFQGKAALLKTIPGIGDIVARMLIAELPELGRVDRHSIAALVGVAPINRDSGRSRGHRYIKGGRPQIRAVLFMPCLAIVKHNQPLREFYNRLIKAGKPKKLALIAVMRKLVVIANAMMKSGKAWSGTSIDAASV
jgi:transposase